MVQFPEGWEPLPPSARYLALTEAQRDAEDLEMIEDWKDFDPDNYVLNEEAIIKAQAEVNAMIAELEASLARG